MKVEGPQFNKINPYQKQNQLQQQKLFKQKKKEKDRLHISEEAHLLQQKDRIETNRAEKLNQIKEAIHSGNYRIDPQKIAHRMIDFWSGK